MRSIFSCCPPLPTSPRTCPGLGGKARRAPRSALRERVVGLAGVTGQVPRPHRGFGGAILEAGLVKQTGGHYRGPHPIQGTNRRAPDASRRGSKTTASAGRGYAFTAFRTIT